MAAIEYASPVFGKEVFYAPSDGLMFLDNAGMPASIEDLLNQVAATNSFNDATWTYQAVRPFDPPGSSTAVTAMDAATLAAHLDLVAVGNSNAAAVGAPAEASAETVYDTTFAAGMSLQARTAFLAGFASQNSGSTAGLTLMSRTE
jgi:hypothetical protein